MKGTSILMATSTDRTQFRVITEDGEIATPADLSMPDRTLSDFEMYCEAQGLYDDEVAQWYVERTDEMLAEFHTTRGMTAYPDANLFT